MKKQNRKPASAKLKQPGTLLLKTIFLVWITALSFFCAGEDIQKPDYRFQNVFNLIKSSENQYLLPVKIGNQVMNLLLDSGSNALLVFADRLLKANDEIEVTDTEVSKGYASTVRSGRVARARVQVGSFIADEMKIMVIDDPDSQHDASLTAKGADGVIGIRRTDGLAVSLDNTLLDVPLSILQPQIIMFELNLPKGNSDATLAFNTMPVLHKADPAFLFQSKTLSLLDPVDKLTRSYSDLQVPFRANSPLGRADDDNLDILLDTGAVSKLVLDITVAETLGYDSINEEWQLAEDDEIHLNIKGPYETLGIEPKFKPSEVTVEDYGSVGVEFEAVLGIDRWQNYIIGFNYVSFEDGGPDGTITFLDRKDMKAALQVSSEETADTRLVKLPGLNTGADESNGSVSANGEFIAFQSNRTTGNGGDDIYIYKRSTGKLLNLKGLNTTANESDPSISSDGSLVAFHTNRPTAVGGTGDYDIHLYHIPSESYIPLPGINSAYIDRNPAISADGRYIVFRSERPVSATDTCYTDNGFCTSNIYMYDIRGQFLKTEALNPGASFIGDAYDPSVSGNGNYIFFEVYGTPYGADQPAQSNPFLFDTTGIQFIDLPAASVTTAQETAVALSYDGSLAAFSTNRAAPGLGLYNRDLVVIDLQNQIELFMPGLNSEYDEHLVQFSPDNDYLIFQSIRPDGKGGKDIYLYRTNNILQ